MLLSIAAARRGAVVRRRRSAVATTVDPANAIALPTLCTSAPGAVGVGAVGVGAVVGADVARPCGAAANNRYRALFGRVI